ncbi:MAG: cytochrome C [candidate division FCPU426 bacterium]
MADEIVPAIPLAPAVSVATPATPPAVKPAAVVPPRPPAKPAAPPWPYDEKVLCYPNMIFHELVVSLGTVVVIWIWSLMMDAPLEEMANPNLTPNPSRAPWYFLGLQELLVYFDPWIAGVLLPQFIVQGLILLPYVDTNPTQQVYYSYKGRELEFWVMSIGFFMWFILIIIGSTMRGPSWQIYMPWESWLAHKPDASRTSNLPNWAGVMALGGYFAVGMALPAAIFKNWFKEKGMIRYALIMTHVLVMFAVPIKILLRLAFNVKYVLSLTTSIGSINF